MELTINEDGAIQSNETTQDISRLENIETLKELMKEVIRSDVENALRQARTLSADVFGFGETIHREYPEDWKTMKEDWDTVFPQIELGIRVNVELRSTGGLSRPVILGGAP
jgi:spore germination protein KC